MFANLRDEINNCFFEGNESAQKLLAEFEEGMEAKSRAAEAANVELSAKLLAVEVRLSEARAEMLLLQQQQSTEAEARGVLEAQLERVEVEKSALRTSLQEAKKAYSIRASQLVDALKQEAETLRQQRLQDGDFSETLKRKTQRKEQIARTVDLEKARIAVL